MEAPKIDTGLDTQIQFMNFMMESNNHEILKAIKQSLEELKSIKEKK